VSYREACLFGWSIAWRQLLWSAAIGIPLALAVRLVFEFRSLAFGVAFFSVFALLMVLVIFPCSIRTAVSKAFTGFRLQVTKAGQIETLTYADAVQISLLAMIVSMVLGGLYSLIEFPSVRLGLLAEVPLLLLVIYPAIAEAAVYVRYRGFRLIVQRG
jgi:hypothetical protein